MAKKVENCSILIVFIARVFIAAQLVKYYAKSEILDCSVSSSMTFLGLSIYVCIYICVINFRSPIPRK